LAVSGPLVVNDFPTMLDAALGGVGLAQVPEPIAAGEVVAGRLEEVLASYASTTPGVFLYHSGHRQVLPKLRAFIDHVRGHRSAVVTFRADQSPLHRARPTDPLPFRAPSPLEE
jgi:DNA-binding transcriptional LysR family regulator